MIALALLFFVIIGLLAVIVWLLQKYFKMYSNLHTSESNQKTAALQSHLNLQKTEMEILQTEEEINTIINKRLSEMEQKFPTEQPQEEQLEMLIINVKKVLHSTLNLLKRKQYDVKP